MLEIGKRKYCLKIWFLSLSFHVNSLHFSIILLYLTCISGDIQLGSADQCVLFFTDNKVLVHVISKRTCRDKDLTFYVHKLILVCLHYNGCFKAKHVPGSQNK